MMVEDSEDHREIYGTILWYNGFNVFLVRDVASAKRAIGFLRPDMILLELQLPDGDGLELCESLRRITGRPIPVFAFSVLEGYQAQARALGAGCAGYIEKGLTRPISLLRTVESVLGKAPASGVGATSWKVSYPIPHSRDVGFR